MRKGYYMEPILLRLNDAADLCSVSRAKLYKMVQEGLVPSVRFGRSLRIPYAALKQSIETRSNASKRELGKR